MSTNITNCQECGAVMEKIDDHFVNDKYRGKMCRYCACVMHDVDPDNNRLPKSREMVLLQRSLSHMFHVLEERLK